MGMLLHRTLTEMAEKGKGQVSKLADINGEKKEEKVEKPATKKKK